MILAKNYGIGIRKYESNYGRKVLVRKCRPTIHKNDFVGKK